MWAGVAVVGKEKWQKLKKKTATAAAAAAAAAANPVPQGTVVEMVENSLLVL